MLLHLIAFVLYRLSPVWMQDRTPDEKHFYRRLFTEKHRAKRKAVKYIWLSAASLLILFPSVPLMVFIGLLSTFLSFSLLDESA